MIVEYIIQLIYMMEPLIEPVQVSQSILMKIVSDLVSKYEVRQHIDLPQFLEESNMVIQEMLLYNNTIEQLLSHHNIQLLRSYHRQIYVIISFLLRILQKVHSKANHHFNYTPTSSNLCSNCQHFIHQRNIKNIQREILDYQRFSVQRLGQQFMCEFEVNQCESDEEEKAIISQSYFRKKMLEIQKSMNERQDNLSECIDDFQRLKTALLLQAKKREGDGGDVKLFNIREYIIEIAELFISNLRKIQNKILQVRSPNHSLQDQYTQTYEQQEKVLQTQRKQQKKQILKLQSEIKKLYDSKLRLEDQNKRYQIERKEMILKIEALQVQNKKIRQEIFSETLKNNHRERVLKTAEKNQQKMYKQKEDEQKHKKQSMVMNLLNLFLESGDFANQFTTILKEHLNSHDSTNRNDEIATAIRSAFKQTLERYNSQKPLVSLSSEKKKTIKRESTLQQPKELPTRSKEKGLKIQMQYDRSRQSNRYQFKKMRSIFGIYNVINYRIYGKDRQLKSINSQPQISSSTTQKSLKQANSDRKIRKRLAKLSIFSDMKQQIEEFTSTSQFKKRRQSTEFYTSEIANNMTNNVLNAIPIKKSMFKRNKSQEDLQSSAKIEDSFKVTKVKGQMIDSVAIRQFFFLSNSQEGKQSNRERSANLKTNLKQSKFMLEEISSEDKQESKKNILRLEELNFLTALFSLLAKIHLINASQYRLLKDWILSFRKFRKDEIENNQSLIIRKALSEIIIKHRRCQFTSILCPHLQQFLHSIQSFLLDAEMRSVQEEKQT